MNFLTNNIKKFVFTAMMVISITIMVNPARSLELNGFSDVTYSKGQDPGNENGSFTMGQVDLYATQEIDDRIDVLLETVIESGTGEWGIDVERMEVGYVFSDELKVRAGRFHNILGYWNTAYHHGAELQTSISRPSFLRFEDDGGMLPVHTVGLWFRGKVKLNPISINYGLTLGNGENIDISKSDDPVKIGEFNPRNHSDNNKNKAVSFNITVSPNAYMGSGIGIFGNSSEIEINDENLALPKNPSVDQIILGADIFYLRNNVEFITEYYRIKDKDNTDNNSYEDSLFYLQAGYNFDKFTPYARYENIGADSGDPVMKALGKTLDNKIITAGLRYDLATRSSLKVEYQDMKAKGSDKTNQYSVQWAFAF